ncbi:hypothetical protein COLO4_21452 [Corchorus olitorius]|uniref:Uncharacterized protein n=1 Tax=Corchorus olitorius TaxID=93759 RepID=A0A1R3IT65_9ROSI|nr:hypothetical protein COLO4_21452 [Corchorus olitorius]
MRLTIKAKIGGTEEGEDWKSRSRMSVRNTTEINDLRAIPIYGSVN